MSRIAKKRSKKVERPAVSTSLERYIAKRSFDLTPEPRPKGKALSRSAGPHFVVQKHAARNLHYDFRLEHSGVLWSWSVPKGPSLKTGARRLAVRTEDHPLSYESFEGVIPKGQYGGGTVIVWDRGTWSPDGDASKGLEKGNLTFELNGEKLRGRFHLVRTRAKSPKVENWLLIKGRDAASSDVDMTVERPASVLSGRTIEEVAAAPEAVWRTGGAAVAEQTVAAGPTAKRASVARASERDDLIDVLKRFPVGFPLTNLDKELYKEGPIRKAELIAYYASVAERMLPYVIDRPLTLVRCPSGQTGHCFYQKHATEAVPDAVLRLKIKEGPEAQDYMCVRDLNGLLALAQLGVLEIHTWQCRADKLERPDQFVFDIDPDDGLPWDHVARAALEVRERLQLIGLDSFVKTTGGKGLHVVVPVARRHDWETHKAFAHQFVVAMARDSPRLYVTNMAKRVRKGKVFLDYLRNGRGATAVAPYSTRARPHATVATPIAWEELSPGRAFHPETLTLPATIATFSRRAPDPWEAYATVDQRLRVATLGQLGSRSKRVGANPTP